MPHNTSCLNRLTFSLVIVLAAAAMSGCSGDDDQIYQGYKCARVAQMLERPKQGESAMARVMPLMMSKRDGSGAYLMDLKNKFADDLKLYRLSVEDKASTLNKVFESDACQRLYN